MTNSVIVEAIGCRQSVVDSFFICKRLEICAIVITELFSASRFYVAPNTKEICLMNLNL